MNALLYLSYEDFNPQKVTDGNILCHNIPGFSLILFYTTTCSHCQKIVPVFKKLPGTIGGCQFGMINISTNKQCIQMAKNSIAPIEYVPYIVLYIDGRPYMVYKGPYDAREIRKFIFEVSNVLQNKQQFSQEKVKPADNGIPAYTIGKPLIGDGKVCYLEFGNAYTK